MIKHKNLIIQQTLKVYRKSCRVVSPGGWRNRSPPRYGAQGTLISVSYQLKFYYLLCAYDGVVVYCCNNAFSSHFDSAGYTCTELRPVLSTGRQSDPSA